MDGLWKDKPLAGYKYALHFIFVNQFLIYHRLIYIHQINIHPYDTHLHVWRSVWCVM